MTEREEERTSDPRDQNAPGQTDTQRPDARIQEEVSWLLKNTDFVDPTSVDVDVRDGVVTLRGTATHPQAPQVAEDRVALIAGVKEVRNELRVRQPHTGR